jgi:hypothetical protein
MPGNSPSRELRATFESRSSQYHRVGRCAKLGEGRQWHHLAKNNQYMIWWWFLGNAYEFGADRQTLRLQDETYAFFSCEKMA